jgi:glycerophosphoryl diester phosphodiesterase
MTYMTASVGNAFVFARSCLRVWFLASLAALSPGCAAPDRLPGPKDSRPLLLAHRGLGQDYVREKIDGQTCTAARWQPWQGISHEYLENTLPSLRAAFASGADIVEFDIHPTRDGKFAVFHDWSLECRTDGKGVTRTKTMDELRRLDVGYGYTKDGVSFPFRGRGVGMMPSLDDILLEFPVEQLLINIKSNDAREGELLAMRLGSLPASRIERLMAYGGDRPISVLRERLPNLRVMSHASLRRCLGGYLALGWFGYVPQTCHRSVILVPLNVAPWLTGFPRGFVDRMRTVGSEVFLVNDYKGGGFSRGLDSIEDLRRVPKGYHGGILTDRVDLLGAELGRSGRVRAGGDAPDAREGKEPTSDVP